MLCLVRLGCPVVLAHLVLFEIQALVLRSNRLIRAILVMPVVAFIKSRINFDAVLILTRVPTLKRYRPFPPVRRTLGLCPFL